MTKRELRQYFDYLPDGTFQRRNASNRWPAGLKVEGSLRSDGYRAVYFKGKLVLIHRAIYIWHHGKIRNEIDHINGKRDDNRIENLREASRSENICNLFQSPKNRSGIKGLYLKHGRWVGVVAFEGQRREVSSKHKAVAIAKLSSLRKELHGEFAKP